MESVSLQQTIANRVREKNATEESHDVELLTFDLAPAFIPSYNFL